MALCPSHASSLACSARTALLAPLLVSSVLCMLSIFQSGRKRWTDLHSQCQLSSGLSEVLCQIPLLSSPVGSEEINQKERLKRSDTLYAATLLLFHKRRTLRSLPVVISFGEYEEQQKWNLVLFGSQSISFILFLCSSNWTWTVHNSLQKCLKIPTRTPINGFYWKKKAFIFLNSKAKIKLLDWNKLSGWMQAKLTER